MENWDVGEGFVGSPIWIPDPVTTRLALDNLRPPARRLDWVPLFRWVGSQADAADRICLRTVDYPDRVQVAAGMIETAHGLLEMAHMGRELPLSATLLHRIHRGVFSKADFRGRWRGGGVRVGGHVAPPAADIPSLMTELDMQTGAIVSEEDLWRWFYRFCTILPYREGNGRVGGIVVAAVSRLMAGGPAWLAPLTEEEGRNGTGRTLLWDWVFQQTEERAKT